MTDKGPATFQADAQETPQGDTTNYRDARGFLKWLITILAVAWAAFQLYTGGIQVMVAYQQRAIHLAFALALIFLWIPASGRLRHKSWALVVDVLLALTSIAIGGYAYSQYVHLVARVGMPNSTDIVMGLLLTVLLLEGTRRVMGSAMVIIALAFLAYAFAGPYLPGELAHRGYDLSRVMNQLFLTNEGIYGLTLGVSATFVYLFVMFGTFLEMTGAGKFFLNLALSVFGRFTGGPAKVAVVASSLFGMVSGAAAANVVGTGSVTIPMMKRIGYRSEFAGAVEAVASTGGQLMPPIMGAAAFIMVDVLRLPYAQIMAAALLPAFLYYTASFLIVQFRSSKQGLRGLTRDELPKLGPVLRQGWFYLIPIAVLIIFLAVFMVSPMRAVFFSWIVLVLVGIANPVNRLTLPRFVDGLVQTGRNSLLVAAVCATAGIIIGSVNLTGLGLKLTNWLVDLSGEHLIVLLVLTMVAAIILGMGLPTTACYVILSAIMAPSLVKIGVEPLAAHFFVFYFGVISAITPPVAAASYVAAGIANAPPLKVGWESVRLGIASFIVPFMFVYGPELLMIGEPVDIIRATITGIIGTAMLAVAVEGYMVTAARSFERVLASVAALSLIETSLLTDVVGLVLFAVVYLSNRRRATRDKLVPSAAA